MIFKVSMGKGIRKDVFSFAQKAPPDTHTILNREKSAVPATLTMTPPAGMV